VDAPLFDCSIYVHQGIFKESISVLFDYRAKQWYVNSGSDAAMFSVALPCFSR
jgi:hypothetical protein